MRKQRPLLMIGLFNSIRHTLHLLHLSFNQYIVRTRIGITQYDT